MRQRAPAPPRNYNPLVNDNTQKSPQTKAELRTYYRQLRASQNMDHYLRDSARITQHVLNLPQLKEARCIYSYLAFKDEVDTRSIIKALLLNNKRLLAPDPDHTRPPLDSIHEATILDAAVSLREVDDISVFDIDLFLVPGIAFDRQGHRIGFGGGYFDRLLSAARPSAIKLGLAFDFQLASSLPRDSWDIPMDAIVTESGANWTSHEKKEGGFSNPPPATA